MILWANTGFYLKNIDLYGFIKNLWFYSLKHVFFQTWVFMGLLKVNFLFVKKSVSKTWFFVDGSFIIF